jgi:hypothetical protein
MRPIGAGPFAPKKAATSMCGRGGGTSTSIVCLLRTMAASHLTLSPYQCMKRMIEVSTVRKKKNIARAEKFAPETPEARDEGPRLIPLGDGIGSIPVLPDHSRYLALADLAMGKEANSPRKPKKVHELKAPR